MEPVAPGAGGPARRFPGWVGWAILAVVVVIVAAAILLARRDDGPTVETDTSTTTSTTSSTTTSTTLATTTTSPATTLAPTTTARAATTAAPATTSSIPSNMAAVTVVNNYPKTVEVAVNGVTVTVAGGRRHGPFAVQPGRQDGNDEVTVHVHDDATCGTGGTDTWFSAGRSYELTVTDSGGTSCGAKGTGSINFDVRQV